MRSIQVKIVKDGKPILPKGTADFKKIDTTSDKDIADQQRFDDEQAIMEVAQFARKVRKSLGMSQSEFSQSIEVSVETIRNWEQGKRVPTGAAKALLRVLDQSPELAFKVLHR